MTDPAWMPDRHLLDPVEQVWQNRHAALEGALSEALEDLRGLLELNQRNQHGHKTEHLQANLGPMGARQINLDAFSGLLQERPPRPPMATERVQRIEQRIAELKAMLAEQEAAEPPVIDISAGVAAVISRAELYFNRMAAVCAVLRKAHLEVRARYEPGAHDAHFADFDWTRLTPTELQLGPPFIVIATVEHLPNALLRDILAILESGLPVKVTILRMGLRVEISASGVGGLSLERIPLACRGVAFLQSCPGAPEFAAGLARVLGSARPAMLSLLARREGEAEADYLTRARGAVSSHAFPLMEFDPDSAKGTVACLRLPSWPDAHMAASFGEYALQQPEFSGAFSEPPAGTPAERLIDLPVWLELNRRQRAGKLPCLRSADEWGAEVVQVVSPDLVAQSAAIEDTWRALREISGEDNPHVEAAKVALESAFAEERVSMDKSLRAEMEQVAADREQQAVAKAVHNLVARLTGVPVASPPADQNGGKA